MLVKNWMSKNVITIDIHSSGRDAVQLFEKHDIRRLPVIDHGELVGIVTDRDLRKISPPETVFMKRDEKPVHPENPMIGDLMTKNPITVSPEFTVEETAEILLNNKISGVPVIDQEGRITGIITQTDIFKILISLTGLTKRRGIQFGLQLDDRPGSIKEVTDIIRSYDGRIASILSSFDQAPQGYRNVYIRTLELERGKVDKLKEELQKKSTLLYMIDHRTNEREIYQ